MDKLSVLIDVSKSDVEMIVEEINKTDDENLNVFLTHILKKIDYTIINLNRIGQEIEKVNPISQGRF